jgi:hypothetical protein
LIAQNGIQVGWDATGTVSENAVSGVWYTGANWGSSGILLYAPGAGVSVTNNDVVNCQLGIPAYWADDLHILRNNIRGSEWGIDLYQSINTEVHYNSITGSVEAGLWTDQPTDATLNWWGDASGPGVDTDNDTVADYGGSGDLISATGDIVIFSPWLGIDPDGDPTQPGVQVTQPMLIIVDDVGPAPDGGYLNTAIRGSNELPYADTIEVRHGTYDASEPVTDAVTILSEEGSASHTTLTGDLSFLSTGIRLGRIRRGFTITGNITVGTGVDATTIHINWNDIFGLVINQGDGVLDATYNWWGGRNPILDDATEGLVDVYPYLPRPSDEVIEFMDEHGLTPDEALLVLRLLDRGLSERVAFLVLELIRSFGFTQDEALRLIRGYGLGRVQRALRLAGDYREFVRLLEGYSTSPAGGAAGLLDQTVAGGAGAYQGLVIQAVYVIGTPIGISFSLTDYAGEPVTDAVCTVTVVRLAEDGHQTVLDYQVIPYNSDTGLYELTLPTDGWTAGYYILYFGFGDGTSEKVLTQLVEE